MCVCEGVWVSSFYNYVLEHSLRFVVIATLLIVLMPLSAVFVGLCTEVKVVVRYYC